MYGPDLSEIDAMNMLGWINPVLWRCYENGMATPYADSSEQSVADKPTLVALLSSSSDAATLSTVRRPSAQCGDAHPTAVELTTACLYTDMDSCSLGKVASP